MKQLEIALVSPPIIGHKLRGTGVYTERLYQALQKNKEVNISLINIKNNIDRFDLIHYPYFDPFFLTLPLVKYKPVVVTVHDLIPLRYPQYFPKGIKGQLKWQIQKLSLSHSDAVITDSFSSSKDIVKFAGYDQSKIHVIHLGVGEEFKVIQSKHTLQTVKRKLQLPQDYLLHVGDINPNKNIYNLMRAFAILSKTYFVLKLVLIGKGFFTPSSELEELKKLIDSLNIGGKIKFIEKISIDELVVVYNLAKLYLQPSLAEGFGLPVVEAMACGVPVVVSQRGSLVEIVGDNGIYVEPENSTEMADKIIGLLSNNKKYLQMKEKGINRARGFNWSKTAKNTVDVYKMVL